MLVSTYYMQRNLIINLYTDFQKSKSNFWQGTLFYLCMNAANSMPGEILKDNYNTDKTCMPSALISLPYFKNFFSFTLHCNNIFTLL